MSEQFKPDECLVASNVPAPGAYVIITKDGGVRITILEWTKEMKIPGLARIDNDNTRMWKVLDGNFIYEV